MTALELDAVRAGYGETVILDGVTLRLARGESLSVVGRNGVGKSSLLATIVGRTRLHGGDIRFAGRSVANLKTHQRSRIGIGFVPQEREVFPSLTVSENLAVAARPGPWTAGGVFDRFPRLSQRRSHRGGQLSGGEQQMLSIGRALMGNPDLLLMDEPSEGLAPIVVEQLIEAIVRLRDDTDLSIVMVEQRVDIALAFSPRCVVMERGRIVFDGESEALANDHAALERLIGLRQH